MPMTYDPKTTRCLCFAEASGLRDRLPLSIMSAPINVLFHCSASE
jgi:hypothetical protein